MTPRYDIRRRALAELDAVRDYTRDQWGAAQARKYVADLVRAFGMAARHPNRFPLVEGRPDGLRRVRSGSHIVVFRTNAAGIEIVRILHERMDIEAQLDS